MKRFLLPVLTWTLAISQLFAQHQMPHEAPHFVEELSSSSKQLLKMAGLDNSTSQELTSIKSRTAGLQLDSTAVFHQYTVNDSTRQFLTRYMYPQDDITVTIDFQYDIDHWVIINRTTTIADELGRIVDIIAQRYDSVLHTYVPESRLEVFPHENSQILIDSFYVSLWNEDGTWSREFSTWNTYDQDDNTLESKSEFIFFGEALIIIDKYRYLNGRLDKIESVQLFEGQEIPGSTQFFLYQDDTLFATMIFVPAGIGELIPDTREEFIHDDQGRLILQNHFTYDFVKQDWKFGGTDGYVYNEAGNITLYEMVTVDENGLTTRTRTVYTYLQDDYVAMEENDLYDFAQDAWVVTDRKYYHYSDLVAVEDEFPADVNELFMFPNPTSGTIQLKLDGQVSVFVYTLTGQMVTSLRLTNGEKIVDLSALPAGLYQVRALSGSDYISGKLFKI